MHSLSDSDVLGVGGTGLHKSSTEWLRDIAWQLTTENAAMQVPATLGQALEQLYEWLATSHHPSLRAWTSFVVSSTSRLAQLERAVSGDEILETLAANSDGWGFSRPTPLRSTDLRTVGSSETHTSPIYGIPRVASSR